MVGRASEGTLVKMPEVVKVETACHAAYLDLLTGSGLLVLPKSRDDLFLGSPHTLHAADWHAMIEHLDDMGWEPSQDEFGDMTEDGTTLDGREVVGLYGLDRIIAQPSLGEYVEAFDRLRRAVGMRA